MLNCLFSAFVFGCECVYLPDCACLYVWMSTCKCVFVCGSVCV